MKKKVKLFSTIASLCLALALMVFGAYAASTATLSLTSSVSYTISGDVNVKFEVEVKYNTDYVTYTDTDADDSLTPTGETSEKTISWEATQATTANDINKSLNLGAFAFKNVENVQNKTIVYTVKITNLAKYEAEVTVTSAPTASSEGVVTIAVNPSTALSKGKATIGTASGSNVFTYEVTYTLADATKDFATSTFNPSFAVAPKAD